MINYREVLQPDKTYQIFNKTVANEAMFRYKKNYYYFLERYDNYISPIAKTYAYCLMPNHFHFLIRIKTEQEIFENEFIDKSKPISKILSKQFKSLFTSYSGAYNKMFDRQGTLFEPRFKRKSINDEIYFINVFNYIHQNPVSHGFAKEKDDWLFSSYTSFYSDKKTLLNRDQIYKYFKNKENFDKIHNSKNANKFAIEMELSY